MRAGANSRCRPASGPVNAAAIKGELATLEQLDLPQLRVQFRNRTGRIAPARLSRHLLMRVLAYRLQAEAFGDLRADVRRLLVGLAPKRGGEGPRSRQKPGSALPNHPVETRSAVTPARFALVRTIPKPGTVLVREWPGRMEHVMVLQDGFAWRGATYASLSAVALAMTGTKWNGHRFFGLRDRIAVAASPSEDETRDRHRPDPAARGRGRRDRASSATPRTACGRGGRPPQPADRGLGSGADP